MINADFSVIESENSANTWSNTLHLCASRHYYITGIPGTKTGFVLLLEHGGVRMFFLFFFLSMHTL